MSAPHATSDHRDMLVTIPGEHVARLRLHLAYELLTMSEFTGSEEPSATGFAEQFAPVRRLCALLDAVGWEPIHLDGSAPVEPAVTMAVNPSLGETLDRLEASARKDISNPVHPDDATASRAELALVAAVRAAIEKPVDGDER